MVRKNVLFLNLVGQMTTLIKNAQTECTHYSVIFNCFAFYKDLDPGNQQRYLEVVIGI